MSSSSPSSGAVSATDSARLQQVDQLLASGEAGVAELVERLDDPSWIVRRSVVAALAAVGAPAVAPIFRALRERRDNEARIAAAVDALVASTGDVDAFLATATDGDPAVLADIAQILGRRRKSTSVPVLTRLAAHADDTVAVAALEALGRVGGRAAVDQLVKAARSGNFFRTFPAIDVLGRSEDPRAVPPLQELLGEPQYTMEAARALGRTGTRGAVAPLAELLTGANASNARIAAVALDELMSRQTQRFGNAAAAEAALRTRLANEQAVSRIGRLLADAEPQEQVALLNLLGAIGHRSAAAVVSERLTGSGPVIEAAARALRRIGTDHGSTVHQVLRTATSDVRLSLLPLVTDAAATDDVLACLSDPSAQVRARACETLGTLLQPRTLSHLFEALSDPNPLVSQAALTAIQAFPSLEVEPFAVRAARSPIPGVRRAALRILSFFATDRSISVLLEALDDPDTGIRTVAIQGLSLSDDPRAETALLSLARSPVAQNRAAAMRALGMSSGAPPFAAALITGLTDADPWVRYYASQSLGRLRVSAAADGLEKLLSDDAPQVRIAAIEALSHLGTPRALTALKTAAEDRDADLQRAALVGLGLVRDASTLPLLMEAARSQDPATRLVAYSSLAEFPSPTVLQELSRALRDPDETVRSTAAGLLGTRDDADATHVLIEALYDASTRELAARSLSVLTSKRTASILEALGSADDEVAAELASVLTRIPGEESTRALFEAAKSPNVAARKAAASALAMVGTREALDKLEELVANDADDEVRRISRLLVAQ